MKKKMSVLGVLLMAVVVTSYSVSGTYAKYISETDAITDSARVAQWTVNLDQNNTQNIDLFKDSYTYGDNGQVVKSTSSDVVAPGTWGQYSFSLSGYVETNHLIKVNVKKGEGETSNTVVLKGEGDEEDYSPIKFAISKNNAAMDKYGKSTDLTWLEYDQFITALEDLYSGQSSYSPNVVYGPGQIVSSDNEYTIYWKWDFAGANTDDAKDTLLGNNYNDHKISIVLSLTAEQTQLPVTTTATNAE